MISLIKKKNLVISTFWEKHASRLKIIRLTTSCMSGKTQALLEERQQTDLPSKGNMLAPHPSSKPSKKRDIDTQVEQIEHDGITVSGSDISLATIIKRHAVNYHEAFALNPDGLKPRQRTIMSASLSSILDLTDQSFGSQRSIFTADQWNYINSYF